MSSFEGSPNSARPSVMPEEIITNAPPSEDIDANTDQPEAVDDMHRTRPYAAKIGGAVLTVEVHRH
jgi:hypothetical protein